MITHSLIKSKFKYFAEVAKSISSFLVTFQTDNPVVLILAQSVGEIISNYASSFLLKDTLSNANSCLHLSKIDFKDSAKQKRLINPELNVRVKLELSHLQKNGKFSTNQALRFKRDIVNFLYTLCSRIQKSPVKFLPTGDSRSFIPKWLVQSPEDSEM